MKYFKPLKLYQDLLKLHEPGRVLGLDVGTRYVGVAVSDLHNKVASPVSVLDRTKNLDMTKLRTDIDLMALDFQNLISEISLTAFVVGCPFDRQRNSQDVTQVKQFVHDLSKTGKLKGVRYTYWDEGFTSKNVELLLEPLNLDSMEAKTLTDKLAAVGILQGYLDYVNRNVVTKQRQ